MSEVLSTCPKVTFQWSFSKWKPTFSHFFSSFCAKKSTFGAKDSTGLSNWVLPMQKHVLREIIVGEKITCINTFAFCRIYLGLFVESSFVVCKDTAKIFKVACNMSRKTFEEKHVLRKNPNFVYFWTFVL